MGDGDERRVDGTGEIRQKIPKLSGMTLLRAGTISP